MMPDATVGNALLVYGPLGIFVVLFVLGRIHSQSAMERERHLTDVALENNKSLAGAMDRLTDTVLRDRVGG